MMRQASHETQIIAATQSPLLLDHFDPEDILVANRIDGATTIERLKPEPLAEWLEDYSLGQLWEKGELTGSRGKSNDAAPTRACRRTDRRVLCK